jgi:amidase
MQDWMASGKLSSRQLVMCYHSRIAQLNEYTKAVVEINPDGLYIADQADAERAKGKVRGPLHGIPLCVIARRALLFRAE